jgi:hypothetical protein
MTIFTQIATFLPLCRESLFLFNLDLVGIGLGEITTRVRCILLWNTCLNSNELFGSNRNWAQPKPFINLI